MKDACAALNNLFQATVFVVIGITNINDNRPKFQGDPYALNVYEVCNYIQPNDYMAGRNLMECNFPDALRGRC